MANTRKGTSGECVNPRTAADPDILGLVDHIPNGDGPFSQRFGLQ